jgi:hypothetical protein
MQHKTELFTPKTLRQMYLCTVKGEKLKTVGVLLNNNMSYETRDSTRNICNKANCFAQNLKAVTV